VEFDIRPHRRRTRTVQSYSLGGANVHPIYGKPQMLAMATSFVAGYRQYLNFVGRPLKPHSITSRLVDIVHTQPVIAIYVPKVVDNSRPHLRK